MKRILTAAGAAGLMLGGAAFAQTADDAFGVWVNTRNKAESEFYKCGDDLCGKLVKVPDGQKADNMNPDPAKRSQPIVGLVYMENFKKTGANKWSGKAYNRMDGQSHPTTLTVKNKNAIELTPCAPAGCVTFKLTRVK